MAEKDCECGGSWRQAQALGGGQREDSKGHEWICLVAEKVHNQGEMLAS